MSELPKRLRVPDIWWSEVAEGMEDETDLVVSAADRIEALEAERDTLLAGNFAVAAERDKLREALEALLAEAEDVFVCMADATGIDRHNHPQTFLAARAALSPTPER